MMCDMYIEKERGVCMPKGEILLMLEMGTQYFLPTLSPTASEEKGKKGLRRSWMGHEVLS